METLNNLIDLVLTEKIIDTGNIEFFLLYDFFKFLKSGKLFKFRNKTFETLNNNTEFVNLCLSHNFANSEPIKKILQSNFPNINLENLYLFIVPIGDVQDSVINTKEIFTSVVIKKDIPARLKWQRLEQKNKNLLSFIINIKINPQKTLNDVIKHGSKSELLSNLSHECVHLFEYLYNANWVWFKGPQKFFKKKKTPAGEKEIETYLRKDASKIEKVFGSEKYGGLYFLSKNKIQELLKSMPLEFRLLYRSDPEGVIKNVMYFNTPSEVQAYSTSILEELLRMSPKNPKELKKALKSSDSWRTLSIFLFPQNKNLILKRIYQYFDNKWSKKN